MIYRGRKINPGLCIPDQLLCDFTMTCRAASPVLNYPKDNAGLCDTLLLQINLNGRTCAFTV